MLWQRKGIVKQWTYLDWTYLLVLKEEQLLAKTTPTQAEPFFISDLAAISAEISKRLSSLSIPPTQLFLLARDQAFYKTLFFAGDRAGDLGTFKTKEFVVFPSEGRSPF